MLKSVAVLSSLSVNDQEKAKDFYTQVLGLSLEDESMGLKFALPGGGKLFIYPKEDHQPATYTALNFIVENIDDAVDELTNSGVKFERYNNMPVQQDEKGIMRGQTSGQGPDIAWFKDPAGNILSLIQDK